MCILWKFIAHYFTCEARLKFGPGDLFLPPPPPPPLPLLEVGPDGGPPPAPPAPAPPPELDPLRLRLLLAGLWDSVRKNITKYSRKKLYNK